MDSTEEVTKPGSSLLESMLTLDSTVQLPRASPMVNPASQAAAQALSKSWGSHGIMAEDTTSGASNVTVRLPIHTVSTSFGVLGSGSLSLKRNNVVGRPMKTDLSGTGRMLTQRKNPSVKLKHLSSGAMTSSVFGGPVKGLKKALEEVSTLSQSPTRESTSADTPVGSSSQSSDCNLDLASDQGANGSTGGGDTELELIEETWPGKVCAFCNLGERSQLGQGEMLRLEVGSDFESLRQSTLHSEERLQSLAANAGAVNTKTSMGPCAVGGNTSSNHLPTSVQPSNIKKPRLALKGRRTSSFDASQSFRSELQEELMAVGYAEEPDLLAIVEPCGYFYAHRMCAIWSKGVKVVNDDDTNAGPSVVSVCSASSWPEVAGADSALIRAASLRCHLCGSFGASLSCLHSTTGGSGCPKSFHFPCAVSCGAFLNAKTRGLHCPDHIHQGSIMAGPSDANCAVCRSPSNVANQLFCVTCGKHFHGSCVGLGSGPGVRTAWQCNECKVCITCRTPVAQQGTGAEAVTDRTKMLVCDTCDKNYHPSCVRPLISNIPKLGWKCKNCRVCGDCGSRAPGSGPSSRWHACFTVCDSCYQQRNKGVSCPMCGKAYRHSQKEMSQCQRCRKFVHSGCDPEADRTLVQRKKDMNSDYEYLCPPCKVSSPVPTPKSAMEIDSLSESNPGSVSQDHLQQQTTTQQQAIIDVDVPGTPTYSDELQQMQQEDTKPLAVRVGQKVMASQQQQSAGKIARKRMTGATSAGGGGGGVGGRPKGSGKASSFGAAGSNSGGGAAYNRKANKLADFGRKRGPKPKMRGVFGAPGVGLQRPADGTGSGGGGSGTPATGNVSSTGGIEGEPCLENKLILCSSSDSFVVEQDACAMCGSFGLDQEGRLISCAQCGQCYHPFCANVKVTKVILQKGWRCLDCTVCEGCGDRHDEARLLLCDECDISYHIYCMEPPLDYVPQGNWKCKWCAVCQVCGSNEPGLNANWTHQANGSLCGPCASLRQCPSCSSSYNEGELIIQCQQCAQWLHAACDLIRNEREAEFCAEDGYTCVLCRPPDQQPPHLHPSNASAAALALAPLPSVSTQSASNLSGSRQNRQSSSATPPPSPVPGLQELTGGSLINGSFNSNRPKSSASSSSQFVVDGVSLSEGGMNHLRSLQLDQPRRRCRNKKSLESDDKDEVQGDGQEDSLFKDGTVLTPREDGRMPDVPEGYAVVQGDNGALILRKKRQRNLQKLGIGGFQVRRPWARVKDKEEDAMDNYNTAEVTLQQLKETTATTPTPPTTTVATIVDLSANDAGKPKRKPQRRKAKNKLAETYPTYLQEAFFGRELLVKPSGNSGATNNSSSFLSDSLSANDSQTARASGSDSEPTDDVAIPAVKNPSIIHLSKEEVADLERRSAPVGSVVVAPSPIPQQQPNTPGLTVQSSAQNHQRVAPVVAPATQAVVHVAVAGRPVIRSEMTLGGSVNLKIEEDPLELPGDNEEEEEDEALKDILPLAGDLLDSDDLVDSIMKEGDAGCNVDDDVNPDHNPLELEEDSPSQVQVATQQQRDELTDILLETIEVGGLPNMDCKDVEDIFKGVLTDESQESQSADFSQVTPVQQQQQQQQQHSMAVGFNLNSNNNATACATNPGTLMPPVATGGPAALVRALSQQQSQQGTASPNTNIQQQPQLPPPCSPYFSEYSSSPGFSPAFSEPPQSPWPSSSGSNVGMSGGDPHGSSNDLQDRDGGGPGATANQRNALKWEADEALGLSATISAVLFANTNHPELRRDFPAWTERWKQIAKIWRSLPADKKAPFLQKARENRAAVRLQKTHHQQQAQQQSTGGAATPTLQRNFSSSSSAASPGGPSAGVELPSPSNSSNGSAEHPPPTVQRPTVVVDGGQRPTQMAVVTVADSMAPSSCCFASSSSATITTTTTRSMQLANDESPAVVEDTGRNAVTGGIESHGIRVLTPSEIMRTLPSIGNAANNSVHHAHHPNVPSGSCPSPAPLQQQHHHHLHHHHQQQQHHQYLHQHHPVALQQHLQQQQQQLHHHHPAEIERPVMAVPRRGVVETEQERQWKQLQAHRQQQQQQQLASGGQIVPLGGHVPVPAGSMAMPPGQPETVIAQQQQQQILQQQPPMPNQQQQQQQQLGGGFATPIQVSRVRAPGEPINGPTGPVFMLRGPGNAPNVQQQTAVVPPSMVMAPDGVEVVDPSVVVSGGVVVDPSRQQLRDLLQRQQMQQQQHRQQQPHFIKTENVKREEDGSVMNSMPPQQQQQQQQQFAMQQQQQQRPQFRYPLPPSATGPNVVGSQGPVMQQQQQQQPMQGAPRMMSPQQQQQHMQMQMQQQQPRPRVFQPGSAEFRQPIQVVAPPQQQQQIVQGHFADPRMRMMMMQQQPQQQQQQMQMQMQRPIGQVQQQQVHPQQQQQQIQLVHPGGIRQIHPGAMMQQQQPMQPNVHPMAMQQQQQQQQQHMLMQQQQPIMQQQQQQQQQMPMKVEMIHDEPPTPCAAAVSAVAEAQNHNNLHQQHDPADDDFGDLGLGCVDDDELLGLGNDFDILEYADPELHDTMDDVMGGGGGQDDRSGHRSSSSAGNGGAGGADSPSDFNILEYADPGDLDGTTTTTTSTTGDESQRPSNEQLTPDELSRLKKEAEEKAAKVAQDMNEFQAKLLELTEQKKQQQLKAEAQQQQQQQQNAQLQQQHQLQGPDSIGASTGPQQQPQQQFGAVAGYAPQQAAQPPPPYRGPPPPYPGIPRAPSSSQLGYGCIVRPGGGSVAGGGGGGGVVVHGCSPNAIGSPVYLVSPPPTPTSLAPPPPPPIPPPPSTPSLPVAFHHHQQLQQQQQQQQQRRSLLLQEQPLLLEDLLEQEKRELQRQHMQHQQQQQQQQQQSPLGGGMPFGAGINSAPIGSTPEKPFLSDTDFEKLKADVLAGGPSVSLSPPAAVHPHHMQQQPMQQQHQQHHLHQQQQQQHIHLHQGQVQHPQQQQQQQHFQHPHAPNVVQHQQIQQQQQQTMQMHRPQGSFQTVHPHMVNPQQQQQPFIRAGPPIQQQQQQQQWHVHQQRSPGSASTAPADTGLHPALLQSQSNASAQTARPPLPPPLLPAMAAPSENVTNEAERQQQVAYEQWLVQQQHLIRQHQVYYETEVSKLRKQRKSLNSRQRQLRKNNQELNDADASELDRITTEQQGLQKQLDQVRRQARQHTMLLQDYRNKQQKRQGVVGPPVPGQGQQQLPASPSPMVVADGSSNFAGFGQPQQLQLQIQQQGQQQQHPQQASPRGGGMVVGGRAGTPQSPHPLLSPVGHMGMTGPLRPPMNPQQQQQVHPQMHGQMMQQQPGGNMMVMMNQQQQHVGGQNATSPHAAQQHQQNHPHMVQGMQQPGQQMMMQPNRNIVVGQQAQFQQVRQQQHPHGSPMCPSSPQVATSSGGPVQSPRMIHQVASPAQMMTTPQPSPSPQMQMPGRVSGQVQQQQQQRPMPAPSPSPSMMMTHSPHGSMSGGGGPMTPGPMTPGGTGQQQQQPSPMPSPHTASGGGAGPVSQQGQMQMSSSSPRGMGQQQQQQQVGTPLSQHSENNDVVALNSPFSPGPMASPQPVGVMGQSGHNPNVVGAGQGQVGMTMRLTSPQSHPPRLPSPQQQQQQQQMQNVQQNVGGGPVRMMGHPGPGVMIRPPMQQQQQYVDMQQQQQHQHQQQQQMQGGPGQVMMQRPAGNMQQQQQHMVIPGQQQQMMGQQRFIRPANVVQQQPGGQVPGGEPVMMIRQRFPMASALQQAAQIQQQQHAPMQPNMQGMQQQQQPMKVNQQQVQQQQAAQMQMQRQQQMMQQQQFAMQQPMQQQQQMQQQQLAPQHQMQQQQMQQPMQQSVQGQLNHQQQQQQPQGHFQPQQQQQTYGNNNQPMQQQQYMPQQQPPQQPMHHQPMQQQQQVYGGNGNNYNPVMRPRAPGTPVTVQQQLSVDSSVGNAVAPSPLQSPAAQQQQALPANQTIDSSDPSGGGGGGGIGSMNVAPHWIVYDSFGFPKIGLKGGGTDGPLSPPPPPVPILPAPEKSEQKKAPEVLLQGDLESATSSSQEVAIVVPEIVQVLKQIEEVIRMEPLMDPLATTSTSEMSAELNVVVPALREDSIKTSDEMMVSDQMLMDLPVGGEMETLEMFHLVEVPEVTEVDMISPSPIDAGKMPQIQEDPIELEEKKERNVVVESIKVETDPLMHMEEVSTILPSLVSDSALEIGATIESSPTMVTSSDPSESSVVKTQFDPVIPKSEALPDVILNEEVVATPGSTAESHDEVFTASPVKTPISSAAIQDPVVIPETEKPPAALVEISVTAPPTVSTPTNVVPSIPAAVTLASKVSLKAPVSYSSTSSMSTTVTTVTLSAIPVSNVTSVPPQSTISMANQSNLQPNVASIPMTSVRTVSVPGTVPTSILVRAPIGNRLSSPLIINQRPLPTLTLNSTQNAPPSCANQPKTTPQQHQQQQTVVLVKKEKMEEEQLPPPQQSSESSVEEMNPILVQQQQQNALLKQLLQGSAAAEAAAAASSASATSSSASPSTVSSTTSNSAAVTTTTTNNSSKPTSLMGLLAKPLTPSKVSVSSSSSGISTTNYGGGGAPGGGVAPNSSTPTTTPTSSASRSLFGAATSLASQLAQPIAPSSLAVAQIPPSQMAQMVSRVPQPPTPTQQQQQQQQQQHQHQHQQPQNQQQNTYRPAGMMVRAPFVVQQQQQQRQVVVVKQEVVVLNEQVTSCAVGVKMEQEESEHSMDSVTALSNSEIQSEQQQQLQPPINRLAITVNNTTPVTTTATTTLSNSAATSEEIRKMKRRQYQQKRRQSVAANNKLDSSGNVTAMNVMGVTIPSAVSLANNNSNNNNQIISVATVSSVATVLTPGGAAGNANLNTSGSAPMTPTGTVASVCIPSTPNPTAKKRSRKGSKYEEIVDYDAFIESVMAQIRTALPPLTVQEPQLGRGCVSSTVTSVFGAGDLTPFASRIQSHNNNNNYSNYSASAVKVDRNGLLKGSYGSAHLPGVSDYYNTRPFGDVEPVAAPPPPTNPPPTNNNNNNTTTSSSSSSQRGFYHQEFAWPRWDPAGSSRHHDDYASRNSRSSSSCSILLDNSNNNLGGRGDGCDTPDTVVSSSSPECVMPEPIVRFPGLRFIDLAMDSPSDRQQNCKSPEDSSSRRSSYCNSPDIPIICAPVPIRPTPPTQVQITPPAAPAAPVTAPPPISIKKEIICLDTENQPTNNSLQSGKSNSFAPSAFGLTGGSSLPLRDSTNVTVTLTLNASAAEDVNQVLCRLAALLRVPPPTDYRIIERPGAGTPGGGGGPPGPSQRLGLYRFKGKDGKEGAPVDIQSILNGTTKFCRHCDVVILGNNKITKKAQLFASGLDSNVEQKKTTATIPDPDDPDGEEEDYHFCSSACFVQFAVAHNTRPSAIEAKEANAVVAHISSSGQGQVCQDSGVSSHSHTAASAAAASVVAAAAAAAAIPVPVQPAQALVPLTPPAPKWKGSRYRNWSPNFQQQVARKQQQQPGNHNKKMTENELTEMLYRAAICIRPTGEKAVDKRQCLFCGGQGDGVSDGPARLINFDVDRWVHLNCALWHEEVFEMVNGALMNVDTALKQSLTQTCIHCGRNGASVKCFKLRCSSVFHLGCAVKEGCVFLKNKSVYCSQHLPKCSSTSSTSVVDIKEEQLTTLSVFRRVYINRDENRQVATVMHSGGVTLDAGEQSYLLRVGSLTFLSVGQLLPHQLAAFHSPNCIYPIGYQVVRFYWSPRQVHKRCRYVCSIEDCEGRPQFNVVVQEPDRPNLPDLSFKDWTCQGVWQQILGAIEEMRRQEGVVRLFPQFLNGEDLFGLNEPAIVRVLESLPGIESLTDYNFKYGRNPLLELPLAVNPTGSARSEPKLRTHLKRFHAHRTFGTSRSSSNTTASSSSGGSSHSTSLASSLVMVDLPGPYSKQFVHSKSSQYKKMKMEWRHNIYLARSKIQGLGLYAARDIEKHTMVIEYIGEMIRAELAECREKRYEAANRGIYMFRLDEQRVIDATLCGGLARYINHSCGPNCVAEAVEVERDLRIIIFASRRISRGEELSYDYKFDIEDDHKIPCLCGAASCRKWMN